MPTTPTLRLERPLWQRGLIRVAGVDEVGVAPTCGAVVAAAVIIRPNSRRIPGVRDSKTLSAIQRERLAPIIRSRALAVGVGAASVAEIDRLNIYHATHLAMRRAIRRLGGHDHVLVDGNRIAGFEDEVGPYSAIVGGDALSYSIACASVVAKVVRDHMMARLAFRYPGYGWERNQGYATLEHRQAIRRLGLTPFHRRSFLALQRTLAGDQLAMGLGPGIMTEHAVGNGAAQDAPGVHRPPLMQDLVADLVEHLGLGFPEFDAPNADEASLPGQGPHAGTWTADEPQTSRR